MSKPAGAKEPIHCQDEVVMHMSKTLWRFGFTLIELLVVIAIISLLISILLPSLSKAKDLAKKAVCQSNLRSSGSALSMYINDHDDVVLPANGANNRAWWNVILPYIGEYNGIPAAEYPDRPRDTVIMCPANVTYADYYDDAYGVGYVMNDHTGMRWSNGIVQWQPTKVTDIVRPSERFYLADANTATGTSLTGGSYTTTYWWSDPNSTHAYRDYELGRGIHPGDGANFLWADGHVSYEEYENWQTDNDWDGTGSGWWTLTLP